MPIHRASQRTVGECPWAFAKINGAATVRERSVPLKSLVLPPASGSPKGIKPSGVFDRAVCECGGIPPRRTAANLSSCEESHEQTATLEECPNWASAPRNPKSPYLKEGAPVPSEVPQMAPHSSTARIGLTRTRAAIVKSMVPITGRTVAAVSFETPSDPISSSRK